MKLYKIDNETRPHAGHYFFALSDYGPTAKLGYVVRKRRSGVTVHQDLVYFNYEIAEVQPEEMPEWLKARADGFRVAKRLTDYDIEQTVRETLG